MEVKPGYIQTDIGSIPDDWACLSLATEISEMTDFVAAGSFESLRNNVHVFDNPNFALYVRLFDLRLGLGHKAQKYVDEKSYKFLSKSNLFGNEILIANIGSVGDAFLMPTGMGAATVAPNMIVVRTNDRKLRFDFLYYYITSDFGQERISELIAGSGQPKINKTDLKKYRVLVPPLTQQRNIAAVLSDVDTLLDSLDRLIAKKRDLKHAAMQQLLTGQTRLPGFSGEWEVKRLGDVAILKNGYAFKSNTYSNLGAFNVITIANVQDGFMEIESCNKISLEPSDLQQHQRLSRGDILISMTGNVGRVCCVNEDNCLLNQRVGKLVPVAILENFLLHLLRQPSFSSAMADVAKGGAQPNLSASDITNYPLHVPTEFSEQAAICEMLSSISDEVEMLESRRNKTAALKQGMMQELLTGRTRLV